MDICVVLSVIIGTNVIGGCDNEQRVVAWLLEYTQATWRLVG